MKTQQQINAEKYRAEIVRLVLASKTDGVPIRVLMAAVNRGAGQVGDTLRAAAAKGLIEARNPEGGNGNRWGAPGIRQRYLDERGKYSDLTHARIAKFREQKRQAAMADENDDIVQRIVPAHLAEPLTVRAPRSVWDLAA